MNVEISFHDTPTRQNVTDVATVVYNASIAAAHKYNGEVWVYPLCSVHRIKELPIDHATIARASAI